MIRYAFCFMLRSPINDLTVPFIPGQRIWSLSVRDEWQKRDCLKPGAFAIAREVRKGDKADEFARHQMPDGCEWIEETDRAGFLMNLENRLVCLTIDAGIGKSTAMLQTQFLRGTQLDGHLVIGEEFDNFPIKSSEYLEGGWLVDKLCENLPPSSRQRRVAQQLLNRKIRTGQFTLLVDGMDQITRPDPEGKAVALAIFSRSYLSRGLLRCRRTTARYRHLLEASVRRMWLVEICSDRPIYPQPS